MNDAHHPFLEIVGLEKNYHGLRPLRLTRLAVQPTDRFALSGLDAAAAEVFVHLVTGAVLPDHGDVRVAGRNTREIATDHEWLSSLDRFGIVTGRAVLLEAMTTAANLALPLTLAIDPMPDQVREKVAALADEVGLPAGRLTEHAATLTSAERVRVHLARALALDPLMLLLEHPTARLDPQASEAIGRTLKQVSTARRLGWVALTEDDHFARASGGRRLKLKAGGGELSEAGLWNWMRPHARAFRH